MAGGIEVSGVAHAAVLEIKGSESVVVDAYAGGVCHIEHRNSMACGGSLELGYDFGEACAVDSPWGDDTNAGIGALHFHLSQEIVKTIGKLFEGVGLDANLEGIVVASDDEYKVGVGGYLLHTLSHLLAETFAGAVESYAVAVAAEVVIVHAQGRGGLGVPCFLLGATVIFHIAVANDPQRLPGKGIDLSINCESTDKEQKYEI